MRRFLIAIITLCCAVELSAQEVVAVESIEYKPIKESLSSFTAIEVDAPILLTLNKLSDGESPYIIYDTKGCYTSKFTFDVDSKSGMLRISERSDSKRESVTEVSVFFAELTDMHIAKANVTINGVLDSQLLDIYVSNDANLKAEIDVLDLMIVISGKSRIELSGVTRYQTADISTAEYDASKLESVSTIAEASHNAIVRVDATERLEARTSTGGKIYYRSQPVILRSEMTLFGGEIMRLKQ